jgi:ubiquinone/menaquinone biosynthesis C-methylase UbiE/uncharacterized protein YbaR (Trm112 family)
MRAKDRNTLVRCPKCDQGLLSLAAAPNGIVHCATCSASYPVQDGVLDLLPGTLVKRTLTQALMESEPVVQIYESRLWRRSFLAILALGISFERERYLIFKAAKLDPAGTVLDLACGPGIYTRPFAQRLRRGLVVGLDLSLPMLRHAAWRAREQRLNNIVLIHGNALHLPFPSDRFDVVNCCGALHLFRGVGRVLREVHRVLKPGGRLTAGASRRQSGMIGTLAEGCASSLGVHPFSAEELTSRCNRVGLEAVQCHYAERLWLIMSAQKPG